MFLVGDDRGSDVALGHHPGGLAQRMRWPDGKDKGGHAVSYFHE
jgi:hypothetical protein